MSDAPESGVPVPEIIASRYRVLRELGRGGMGAVHLVEHLHTGEQFALKVLLSQAGANAELVTRFKREARAPARIKSDHVVKVIDADVAPELGGAPFLVMELLDGASLEDHIYRAGPLSPAETIDILRPLGSALSRAHAIGIVHRDLKPDNVFLHHREGQRVVKLLDFGISKLMDETSGIESASLTRTGAMIGTPLYMSPEQARGDALIGPPTDIWAIGLIAFRMLTNTVFWDATSLAVLMAQIVALPLPAPSSKSTLLPVAFDAWFARSCDRDPAKRFPSAEAQIEALAAALGIGQRYGSAPPQSLPQSGPSYPRYEAQPLFTLPPQPAPAIASTDAAMVRSRSGSLPAPKPGSSGALLAGVGALVVVAVIGVSLIAWNRHSHAAAQPIAASSPASASAFPLASALPSATAAPPPSAPPMARAATATTDADAGETAPPAATTTGPAPKPTVPRPPAPPPPAATTYAPRAL